MVLPKPRVSLTGVVNNEELINNTWERKDPCHCHFMFSSHFVSIRPGTNWMNIYWKDEWIFIGVFTIPYFPQQLSCYANVFCVWKKNTSKCNLLKQSFIARTRNLPFAFKHNLSETMYYLSIRGKQKNHF